MINFNIKRLIVIVFALAAFPLIFVMKDYSENLIKNTTFEVTAVPETTLSNKVYGMTKQCGIFTSEIDCLEQVKMKIDMNSTITATDKVEALVIAKKIVFMIPEVQN